jgi:hypothetical protein
MQEPSRDQSKIKEIQSTLASLDLDVKLLRLGMKAGFNPSQPRVPAGDPDGGQWTDAGERKIRGSGPICVYDLKTGRRGLSKVRTLEFAVRLAKYGRPIIVIEIRPFE